jgi:heme-degrading monooxygenase HmoA
MFARVTTLEGDPEQVDELTRLAGERVLPALKELDGFNGALGFADRQSGKVLAVTLWENEQAVRASAEAASGTIAGVDRYEVTFAEIKGTEL